MLVCLGFDSQNEFKWLTYTVFLWGVRSVTDSDLTRTGRSVLSSAKLGQWGGSLVAELARDKDSPAYHRLLV